MVVTLPFELRDFHQFAVFQCGLMGDDASDRQIERHADIHERLAVL
jgi:hypothetical protein